MAEPVINKYLNSKIYRIFSYSNPNVVYYGSTTQSLSMRMVGHRANFKAGNKKISSYKVLVFDDAKIELVEAYPCNNKDELNKREGIFILNNACCNKNVAGRTQKEHYEANKEQIKEYYEANKEQRKDYIEANKEHIKEQKKEYYVANKEQIKEQMKEHYEANKEQKKEYQKEHYEANKEQKKEYYVANKDAIKDKAKLYREKNIDKAKAYRELTKESIQAYNKNKYIERKVKVGNTMCPECGLLVASDWIQKHTNSKYHQRFMKALDDKLKQTV